MLSLRRSKQVLDAVYGELYQHTEVTSQRGNSYIRINPLLSPSISSAALILAEL